MAKYCPSCGAEVKEGFKFCLSCGAQLQANAQGSKAAKDTVDTGSFEDQVAVQPETGAPVAQPQQPMPPPVIPGQTYGQSQTHAPLQPKKPNMKLIGVIAAIVIVVVVIAVVFFMFIGGADSRFVGEWEMEGGDGLFGSIFIFEGNGDWKIGSGGTSMKVGTWNVQGDNFCFKVTDWLPGMDQSGGDTQCYQYELSNNGDTLTFSTSGYTTMTLIKK